MRKTMTAMAVTLLLISTAHAQETFPDFTIAEQLPQTQKTYLGVQSDSFRLSDINSRYLFIEIFNMYCPICQRDAPGINDLYERIQGSTMKDQVKIVGIGAGNSPYEVNFYRKKFDHSFPLLPDEDYSRHKALGNVGTPYFVLAEILGPDNLKVLFEKEGGTKNKNELFDMLRAKTGIKP